MKIYRKGIIRYSIMLLVAIGSQVVANEDPPKPTISVSGASKGAGDNYYVIGIPEPSGGKTTVTITGSGDTPCLADDEKCECGDQKKDPAKDGDPIYAFSKTVGNQDPADGPTIKWEVDSSTSPGEYKFKVTEIKQKYKDCEEGWTGGVASKSNTKASDEVTVLAVKVEMSFASTSKCDGEEIDVDLTVAPSSIGASDLSSGNFTCQKPGGGTTFDNPSGSGSNMVLRGSNQKQWKIDNVRWYSTQSNHCNNTSDYEAVGTIKVKGVAVDVKPGNFTANATVPSSCIDGSATTTQFYTGTPTYTTVQNGADWETTITAGSFKRDVQATSTYTIAANSQYKAMLVAEEVYHEQDQFENASHHIIGTLFLSNNIITSAQAGQPYKATTQAASLSNAKAAFAAATALENVRSVRIYNTRRCDVEREAKSAAGATHRLEMPCTYAHCP